MDVLMIPIVQAPRSQITAKVDSQNPGGTKTAPNFSDYMEKKMVKEKQGTNDLFGLPKAQDIPVSAAGQQALAPVLKQKKEDDATGAISTLLGQFVQDLQKSAGDQKQGAGEWSFPVPAPDLMQKIAKDAGMNESQLTMLMEKMKNKDGKLDLVDFLASFSRHFQNLQNDLPVTVPETELPLLQSFLERLGLSVPEVSRISEAAVRGDNTLDLQKFLAGLKDLPEIRITDITPVEAEQLHNLLAEVGASQQLQRALLPERLPVIEGLVKDGPPVTLTLDRLKNMLAKAVDEVRGNRLQADPLSFLTDLQEILVRSGFEAKGPSLSSAVQGTVVAIFEKLMESVDLSKGKVIRGSFIAESMMEKNDLAVSVGVDKIDQPLLRNMLERFGVSVPEMSRISDAAARGDNTFALQKVVDLLQGVMEARITDLTTEVNRVSEAAVRGDNILDLQKVADLLQILTGEAITGRTVVKAEQLPVMQGLVESNQSVALILDSLKNMLAQAVREVKANRLQTDPLSLLADLQEVLAPSGFATNGQRQLPVAQGSLVTVFEKLMESVDLSKGKVIRGSVIAESMMEKNDLTVLVGVDGIDQPLLRNMLERFGVSVPEMSRISDAAARGDNTFALQKVVDLLQGVMEAKITDLTTEVNRVSEAAVRGDNILDLQKVADLLQILTGEAITGRTVVKAEQLPVMQGLVESNQSVALILDSLKNMLAQAVREVKANRLQTDPLSLLADLQEVLAPSGFATNGQRQLPVAQGSLVTVFEKLMASVDLSKVQVQQGVAKLDKAIAKNLGEALNLFADQNSDTVALFNSEFADPVLAMGQEGQPVKDGKGVLVSGELFVENSSVFQGEAAVLAKAESVGVAASSSQAARPFVHIPNLPPGVQQQSFAQLSQGVLQGLRNQEHHLVLKLYPKELGEVKVEMMVRDNQVAISFLMENSRVKAVLESNLEQFKENMEKQGFIIGDCMVSLNRDTDSNESWQKFQAASLEKVNGRRLTTLADLPDDIFYQRVQPGNGRESGVDLFA